jgi:hypothetical protein
MTAMQHVGGGTGLDLPTTPIVYRGDRKPAGLDWGQIRDQYVANGGVAQPELSAQAETKIHYRTGLPSTYATPKPVETRAPKPPGDKGKRLTNVQRAEIARRYAAGESAFALQTVFGISYATVTRAVTRNGGRIRTLAEAAANRRAS